MTAWDRLPNAKLIRLLIDDYVLRTQVWAEANAKVLKTLGVTHSGEARPVAWAAIYASSKHRMAGEVMRSCVGPVWNPCLSLIAWPEDSALMLDMPVDAVRLLAASGHHPAVLMLPACIALGSVKSE